jgi:hypothetical protein
MEPLTKAHELLTVAARLLDEVAEIYAGTDFPEQREQVARIGRSLAMVFEIQQAIYERHPELKPKWLEIPSPHPEESREYGRLLIETMKLWESDRRVEAVTLLKAYLSHDRPSMFREIATRQLEIFESARQEEGAV